MPPPRAAVRAVNVGQSMTAPDVRSRVGDTARRAAWIGLCVVVVLSPLRAWLDVGFDVGGSASPTTAWSLVAALATLGFWVVSLAASPRRIRRRTVVHRVPRGRPARRLLARYRGLDRSGADRPDRARPRARDGARRLHPQRGRRHRAPRDPAHGDDRRPGGRRDRPGGGAGIDRAGSRSASRSSCRRMAGSASSLLPTARYWLRAYGLTDHPNILGGILAFALIILGSVRGLAVAARLRAGSFSPSAWSRSS